VDGRPYRMSAVVVAPLRPGSHEVVVDAGGRRIHSQYMYVAAGARAGVRIP